MIEIARQSTHEMTYEEAILYCHFLEYNGHRDWRMPTHTEYSEHPGIWGWFVNRSSWSSSYCVVPVRDV